MFSQGKGCIRLGQVAGITLYLHWTWFLVAYIEITQRREAYPSVAWNVAEYLALFGIVLLHELGHSLACRQVGGKAEYIVLWPLGGVAVVNPPPRPGAHLWSIAAGPLVNVVLLPVTIGLCLLVPHVAPPGLVEEVGSLCLAVAIINFGLLVFNLLPVYPLDGGQILYSLLWFVLGRVRALRVSCVLGLLAAAAAFVLALSHQDVWLIILAVFVGLQAINGLAQARMLAWLQPAVDHLNRAVALVQQGAAAEAVAECDKALELIPEGHTLRDNAYACRAMAVAQLGQAAAATCPKCNAALKRPVTPGAEACWNCGWISRTA
jgi:Zn-dependent protease